MDRQRLGKQRVEAWQILRSLTGETKGWKNHPAVKMWIGYECTLALYGQVICEEWVRRGYRDTMTCRFTQYLEGCEEFPDPPWLGDPEFHASHRSNLLRKDPIYYSQFGWSEGPDLPYVWPKGESDE